MAKTPKIALIGNPNAGKSSLFNSLTGLNQKTGNFPGVTMEKLTGIWELEPKRPVEILDLPGIYSIYPKSIDEELVINILGDPTHPDFPDMAIVVADASNLKRNLLLFSQVRDLGIPTVLALNMIDVAENEGYVINSIKLARELNVEVAEVNAKKGIGLNGLKLAVIKSLANRYASNDALPLPVSDEVIQDVQAQFGEGEIYRSLLWLMEHDRMKMFSKQQRENLDAIQKKHQFSSKKYQSEETVKRYEQITEVVDRCVINLNRQWDAAPVRTWTDRLDKFFLHPVGGYVFFLAILFVMFQAIFTWATYPMDAIDGGVAMLNDWLKGVLPDSALTALLTDGLIAGIGGVLIFIPQIAFLFLFISLLEETGYMSRVMFIMDKLMRRFGLNGKSVVPLISGVACAVPAIMSTRSIGSWKDRLITILVTPLMSCSARLPIYTVLIALVVPENKALFGLFNLQGVALFGLYLLGFFMALVSAWVMKVILKAKEKSYFIMELPTYKGPRFKHVALTIWNSVNAFVFEAGKIIVAISIVLWVLASYGPGDKIAQSEARVRQENPTLQGVKLQNKISAEKLENSYAGHFGHFVEPVIRPLGYDWKIGIALITSFAAREVFVGTMSTIYSMGGEVDDENATIKNRMRAEINPATGKPMYDAALGFSLLIFYAFAMQCMSTLATTYRETKSWKYPLIQFGYMTALAYLSAFAVYQLLS
ncbi:ferrous iron transport protein B [Aquirufa lenticrescens]|uniref:ferrous iron transport protein B n=1 Tax=Aquirufa lenticrescens TaxID=2696560 RepID=UPI001CAA4A1F|nr:ferrous iron transport protein B [Aquirufa lenticrescens]UAJ13274.1 ferrous iron transport protein B [Aquirufa lenticrescens]